MIDTSNFQKSTFHSEKEAEPYTLKTIPVTLHANNEGVVDISYIEKECEEGHGHDAHDRLLDCRVHSAAVDTVELDTIITGIEVKDKKCIVHLCGEDDDCVPFINGESPVEFSLEVGTLLHLDTYVFSDITK